jgi:hypothetical protein
MVLSYFKILRRGITEEIDLEYLLADTSGTSFVFRLINLEEAGIRSVVSALKATA